MSTSGTIDSQAVVSGEACKWECKWKKNRRGPAAFMSTSADFVVERSILWVDSTVRSHYKRLLGNGSQSARGLKMSDERKGKSGVGMKGARRGSGQAETPGELSHQT